MASSSKGAPADVQLGVDGKPTNQRHRNMFEEEIVLTDKQKMRNAMLEDRDKVKDALKKMTPIDIFILFDEDDSGLISFEEFRKMLPFLNINISDAKALRYFRLCDTDGSGEIDIDEFKVALFACDPTSGNPVGYKPSGNLTPMDAFELFDEDQSGYLDEDEYRYACEYLKIAASDEVLEDEFFKADYNLLGKIDYVEFREIFLKVCDVRKELEDRGVDTPALIRRKTLVKMLREILVAEEIRERKAIAEARRYKKWVLEVRESRKIMQKAQFRAYYELRCALDAAGHVYVIGAGTYGQFNGMHYDRMETKKFKFEHFDRILELWKDRVQPQQLIDRLRATRRAEEQEEKRDEERNVTTGIGAIAKAMAKKKLAIDPYAEALQSPFMGLHVAVNTASLWGKRVYQVATSENVIFALADTGEVLSWGGNSFWWHEIQPDSIYQRQWRGDTTARSQLLLGTKNKSLPPDPSLEADFDLLTPDDKKAEKIKTVAKYFNSWMPPPNPAERMIFLEKDILPRLEYDDVKFSLECRGKKIPEMTKMQLIEQLYEDIVLEKRLLGEKAHKAIREIEVQVASLLKRKKDKLANKFLKKVDEMWTPLREVQAESRANDIAKQVTAEHEGRLKREQNYHDWRRRVVSKRENIDAQFTPRGNSLDIDLIGTTPRGPSVSTPRGYEAALQISAGNAHACLIHKTGQLYVWGVGVSGRLGLDMANQGDPQSDTAKPALVQALAETSVVRVSCGFSHTAAIVAGGALYMWGSTATGKCGLGPIVKKEECYCSIPTRVLVGPEARKAKKVSCGAAHTAVVTETGQLYVFGCGDGGRLGLAPGQYDTHYVPVLVECLLHEQIATVSCGNTTTVVATEIGREWVGDVEDRYRRYTGGKVYITGSGNVFGRQIDRFEHIPIRNEGRDDGDPVCIKQVSAGYMHTALVSAEGELYCWGHNKTGCCGQPLTQMFVPNPTPVPVFYTRAINLALNKRAYQSSTYNQRDAKYAVNGRKDGKGVNKCTCTQQEAQPWIEIDLGKMAVIDRIVVWNRTDSPQDRDQPRDLYTARLFPCWVMIGRDPFPTTANVIGLKEGLRTAVCRAKLTEDKRVSTWKCPSNSQGRYIRVQLEQYNSLSVAEIEVFGYWGYNSGVGRCSYVSAGRDVTVAVIRPSHDPRDVENFYKRAAYADSANADILRQIETYVLEYDKFGRGDVLQKDCAICRGVDKCESCIAYETFEKEIANMPPVVGGRRRRLNSITDYLINDNKPPVEPVIVPRANRPTKWQIRKDAFLGRFKFAQYFFPKTSTFIKTEEALSTDPRELMTAIDYMKKVDHHQKYGATQGGGSVDGQSLDDQSSVTMDPMEGAQNTVLVPLNEELSVDDDTFDRAAGSRDDGSIGLRTMLTEESRGTMVHHHKPHRHGFGKSESDNKIRMKVGDVLPTGQVIKSAFPKSVVEQLNAHGKKMDEIDLAEKAALKKKKEASDHRKLARKMKHQIAPL